MGGHEISAAGIPWSPHSETERKVVLWSRSQWGDVQCPEDIAAFGGVISGETEANGIRYRVIGLCIPYASASPLGQHPKRRMWEQHKDFLNALSLYIPSLDLSVPTITLGDFNRTIPSSWGSKSAYAYLIEILTDFAVLTAGLADEQGKRSVDHICVNFDYSKLEIASLWRGAENGKKRSDHSGVFINILPAVK